MAISLRRIKHCMALSAIVLATAPLAGCLVRQSPSQSALDVDANVPVGKSKSELTKLVDANSSSGRLHRSADAYIGKVSPAIFNQLKYLPLIAPAYVPDGFSLVKYDIPASGYILTYSSNSTDQCFAIEYDVSKQLTAGNSASASRVVTDSAVSEIGNTGTENESAELSDVPTAGAISSNFPTDEQSSIEEDTDPAVDEPIGDTLEFEVFDSPLFGSGQKLFYGESADRIEVAELALSNQTLDSDDTALDFLAEEPASETFEVASEAAAPATGSSSSTDASLSRPTASTSNGQDSFVSQWLRTSEGAYRYVSGSIVTQNYSAQNQCGNVSLEEGVKIVTSLTVLSADSTGALESNLVPSDDPVYSGADSQN